MTDFRKFLLLTEFTKICYVKSISIGHCGMSLCDVLKFDFAFNLKKVDSNNNKKKKKKKKKKKNRFPFFIPDTAVFTCSTADLKLALPSVKTAS